MTILLTVLATALVALVLLNVRGGEKKIERRPCHLYPIEHEQFLRTMGTFFGPPLRDGNRITPLVNGDRIFPAMLDAIAGARATLCFETYIYWEGRIGRRFTEALSACARRGVKVHVLVDWAGSQKMDATYLEDMERAGVEVRKYRPLRWYNLSRLNNRTHRKLLIVDGVTGFTGGVGIADDWLGDAQGPENWRDTHFHIEGPVVGQMQATFMDNWTRVTGKVLHGPDYFPPIPQAGTQWAQMFQSSAEGGSESMHLMYLLSIAAATRSIDLGMAYFVPDRVVVDGLLAAVKRGVRVRVIIPGKWIDAGSVRHASRAKWGPLLEAGVEIHQYRPTMFHCKVLVVDGVWVSVGSTNFDSRSFRLNDEANLNVYDPKLACELVSHFERDLERATRVTLEQWRRRPLKQRVQDRVVALFSSQI